MKTLLLLLAITTIHAADIVEHLKAEEGFSATAYKDTLGNWTVGYGHKTTAGTTITKEAAEVLLLTDIKKAQTAVTHLVGSDINSTVRLVITSMVFQMGEGGVAKFKKTLKLLRAKDFTAASVEMLKSDWAKQTPERARRLAAMIAGIKA